jgi:hypothetical protein
MRLRRLIVFIELAGVLSFPSIAMATPPRDSIFVRSACQAQIGNSALPVEPGNLMLAAPAVSDHCASPLSYPLGSSSRFSFLSQDRPDPGKTEASPKPTIAPHRFWDRENIVLFSAVGASRALDYSSTLNFRRRGRNEVFLTNDIVDNHAAFAVIEAGGTAVSIGMAYLFHRYSHHRLEHWTSIVHASLATGGAIRNYSLTTAHN